MTSASNASNTYQLSGSVPEKSFVLLRISVDDKVIGLSNESGTAWLQDRYGVIDYPSGVTPYEGGDRVANKGRSWAYNEQVQEWQWATPAPWTFENNFTLSDQGRGGVVRQSDTLKPCLSHQFRNPLTNRCKSTATQTNSLKPCRPDQYRNPETNRCRSNTVATSTLKPCRSDQVRNPATNRCKKAVAVGASLADCGPGRERNPETNRCRNIRRTTPPESGFAIEPVADSASVFIGWWVLGGIAFAAAGYASWEWRAEIGRLVRRIFRPNSTAE